MKTMSNCKCGDTRERPLTIDEPAHGHEHPTIVDNDLHVCRRCDQQANPIWISSDDEDIDGHNESDMYRNSSRDDDHNESDMYRNSSRDDDHNKSDMYRNSSRDDDHNDNDIHRTENRISAITRFGMEQKEPHRELIFCLAMSWSHPTDSVRLTQLQNDGNLVVSVSSQTNVPGNHIDCNFKTDRGIKPILDYLRMAKQRESFRAVTLILDYFFLEKNYYQSNYGMGWLSSTGYRLLSGGMTRLLLPNDNGLSNRFGNGMKDMLEGTRHPALVVSYIPATDNPLWVASNHESVSTECTFGKIRRLDNPSATIQYLDAKNPFVSVTLSPLHNGVNALNRYKRTL